MSPAERRPAAIALVGAGPTATSLLERLVANAELLDGQTLQIHLVDPHRRGLGRVWRPDQHASLWMNSMAEDVTMFTDASVRCAGPIRPGPTLHEWATTIDDDTLADLTVPHVAEEIRQITGTTFPTRLVQSAYLEWYMRRILHDLPPGIDVIVHRDVALDVTDLADGRQRVQLADADALEVDAVVFALGHIDTGPPDGGAMSAAAARHGLVHLPAGHTAEQDLSVLRPGDDVIALGFGQAFTDLLTLVTEGRGGRFVDGDDGRTRYEPSGDEPIIHVGSRRGVPYRAKLDYRLQGPPAPLPRFLDEAGVEQLLAGTEPLEFWPDVYPLIAREAGWAYYHELFNAHGERTTCSWGSFADQYATLPWGEGIDALVAASVPDPQDRFDIPTIDRPLDGLRFASADDAHAHVAGHVRADVARRTDPAYSADLGAFLAFLWSFGALGRIGASGRMTPRSRVRDLGARWFSFFMYYASGPPPARLRQLLALADVGLVRFIGGGTTVTLDEERGAFVARSTSHDDELVAGAYVDARIAPTSVSRATDPLMRQLYERGEVSEEVVTDGDWHVNTGKLVTSPQLRVVMADGTAHPSRFAAGIFTDRAPASAFARPRTNAPSFRQNDALARTLLADVVERTTADAADAPVAAS